MVKLQSYERKLNIKPKNYFFLEKIKSNKGKIKSLIFLGFKKKDQVTKKSFEIYYQINE